MEHDARRVGFALADTDALACRVAISCDNCVADFLLFCSGVGASNGFA